MKKILIICVGMISFFYIINPGAGIFELIPDNIPFVGNLDEATATTLLLSVLAYFGIDFGHFFNKEKKRMQETRATEESKNRDKRVL